MKTFTTQEIRDLFGQVVMGEISFSRMVEIMNERVREAENPCIEDIPVRKFKKGDKVRIKESKTNDYVNLSFVEGMDDLIGETMVVDRYTYSNNYVKCEGIEWRFLEDWLELYVEDIPKRKFQKGDKVRIKDGVSSWSHRGQHPYFAREMDDLIGKTMTVNRYTDWDNYVNCDESGFLFHEDWLEPYVEELK